MNIVQPTTSQSSLSNDLIAKFRKIVGDKYALTDKADIAPYTTEERDLFHGHSPLVLRPGSTAEVAAICKLANEHKIALVPQGGNTGLVGGQTPHNGEVVISLKRMDKIRDVDTASNTMTCEAGVILQIAQQRAADVDRLFPLSLGAEGSCTIGGNLSTNAGGTTALAYGVAREMALGVEAVLADGRVLNLLSKLKKDNTGYDLRNLFIGAEGTLGIITAATLKIFPKPRAIETAYVGLQSPAQALKLLSLSQNEAAGTLTSFELLSELAVDFSVRHGIDVRDPLAGKYPWYVLMELSSPRDDSRSTLEAILAKGMEDGIVDDAVIAANLSQRQAFWKLRDEMSAAQKPEGGSIKHDISVPVAAVPDFIAEADAAVVKLIPGSRPVPFGHLGDGNIHYNVSQPVGGDTAGFMDRWHEVNKVVFDIVLKMGGSISAEHGIGVLKRDELPDVKDKTAIELMRAFKAMLDPNGIMNPGKVL
jgi:FAD/FMN-containing dehydrogenase